VDRIKKLQQIRNKLKKREVSLGSWMQIPDSSVAEIIGHAGYDWVTVDLEHGTIGINQLPDLFRSLEGCDTLPLARLAEGSAKDCKQSLDAGAGGVIVPMVESAKQLKSMRDFCYWPPAGRRGVGFSRANLFGKFFKSYTREAQSPFLVAMIESIKAVDNLEEILKVDGLDAILVGPYDLSASMNLVGDFKNPEYKETLNRILNLCKSYNIPCGIHIVIPSTDELEYRVKEGFTFIAYSIDAVFLNTSACRPPL
jgi:2-dehydro-3-deoxyglucarate aldolase